MERIANAVLNPVLRFYSWSLNWFLIHKWVSALTWLVCMVGTIWLFVILPKSFLPIGDSSFIIGVQIAQEGSSPRQMVEYQTQADAILRQDPAVHVAFTLTGVAGFLPSNQGLVLAFLYPPDQRLPIPYVAGNLMKDLSRVQGTMAFLRPNPVLEIATGATAKLQGQFAFAISGIDPEETYALAEKLMARFQEYDGFASVSSDLFNHTPNLEIEILRDEAASYGVSIRSIEDLLRQAYSQNYVYLIKRPEDQYQVILEVADAGRAHPEDLDLLYVKSDDGKRMVPLRAVVKWRQTLGPQSVNHINQFTSVTTFFNLKPDCPIGEATEFVEAAILMALAVFVMYVILGILYESYVHPITVLSSLPVALVGGLATLHVFGAQASLYAFIGMFMLMGIVKKNGIMMIDFALQRLATGSSRIEAIHDASVNRFRPIIMTTLAALMGALPIALGYGADGASRQPLGLLIVGGLVVSQLLTLYVTPALYLYMEAFQTKVLDRTSFFHSHRVAVPMLGKAEADGEDVTGHAKRSEG
jgi:HAE1 family hydrophobic/amphiphilic exporter-1